MPLIVGNRIQDIKPEIVVPRGQKGAKNPLVSEHVRAGATHLIYTPFLYFNWINIHSQLIYDKYTNFLKIRRSRFGENPSTSSVPNSTKSLLYTLFSIRFKFRSSETYGCETQGRSILTYVNINFRFFYLSQNLFILLVASRQFKFQISRLCDFPKTRTIKIFILHNS